jgi:hypothetical protein
MLDAMTGAAAVVANGRLDVVATNALGRSLQPDVYDGDQPPNLARYCFFDPRSRDFYDSWDAIADVTVQILRTEAGRNPHDKSLIDLVGELATRSDEFSERWARHDVRLHRTARKRLHNAVVGELELTGDALQLPGEDLTLVVYTAEAGSPAQEKLDFLARWVSPDLPLEVPGESTDHGA